MFFRKIIPNTSIFLLAKARSLLAQEALEAMESIDIQIAEKELAIISKEAELAVLRKELEILQLRKRPTLLEEDEKKVYWYAVFSGPKKGIFTNIADIREVPPHYFKQFATRQEAIMALEECDIKNQQLASYQSSQRIASNFPDNFRSMLIKDGPTIDEWVNISNRSKIIRIDEGGAPILLRNRFNKVITYPGINPGIVAELFGCGLLHCVYTSSQLTEIQNLPQGLIRAVEIYVRRIKLEQHKFVYLTMYSSIPDWSEGRIHSPYHYVELGSTTWFSKPEPLEGIQQERPTVQELVERRIDALGEISQRLLAVKPTDERKMNYLSDKIIIISKFNKKIAEDDFNKVKKFGEKIDQWKIDLSSTTLTCQNDYKQPVISADVDMVLEEDEKVM